MGDIATRAERLSKQYKIVVVNQRCDTLCNRLTDGLKGLFRRHGRLPPPNDIIWALRDVSLEVRQGEVAGIISRDGAGKRSPLKILTLITKPTTGRAKLYGRVRSLLEAGTGSHFLWAFKSFHRPWLASPTDGGSTLELEKSVWIKF